MAASGDDPNPTHTCSACCHGTSARPASAAVASTSATPSRNRSGVTHSASHPSDSRAARRNAAGDRPPTITGTGGSGVGRIRTSSTGKKPSVAVTVSPANSRRIRRSDSSVRRPRVRRVDAAGLDLVAVLTTDADAEREAARRQLGERGDLAGHRQRVPQRQEVDGRADADRPSERSECGGLDEPVEALPTLERHVVPDAELVDAGRLGTVDDGPQIRRTGLEQLARRAQPDAHRRGMVIVGIWPGPSGSAC